MNIPQRLRQLADEIEAEQMPMPVPMPVPPKPRWESLPEIGVGEGLPSYVRRIAPTLPPSREVEQAVRACDSLIFTGGEMIRDADGNYRRAVWAFIYGE
jgi:hypothetical protein